MRSNIKAKAIIKLDALKHNLSKVKRLAPDSKVLSVIKANAYGHGILPVAKALIESDSFAVARLDEAIILKKGLLKDGVTKEIIILEGVFSAQEYLTCIEYKLIPVIHCLEQFQWLQNSIAITKSNALDYWLKIDTGMHRLGLSEEDLTVLINQYQQSEDHALMPKLPTAFISHFSCADEIENSFNQTQITQFESQYQQLSCIKEAMNIPKSMANSAAVLSILEAHLDWVRPGIMLYGISPFETAKPSRNGLNEELLPVMTLCSELIAIKNLKKGDCVGYGASWCCPEDMTVGVIAIGYGDGYPRHAPTGTPVLLNGLEVPLVGRVSMDMITVDLRLMKQKRIPFKIGDKAILWGDGLPIEKISQKAGTIAYELLCQITRRVRMIYVDSSEG